jgi:hypothetical protein
MVVFARFFDTEENESITFLPIGKEYYDPGFLGELLNRLVACLLQCKAESAPLRRFAVDPDSAAMGADDLVTDPEAKS